MHSLPTPITRLKFLGKAKTSPEAFLNSCYKLHRDNRQEGHLEVEVRIQASGFQGADEANFLKLCND